jgi:hypothetical protein
MTKLTSLTKETWLGVLALCPVCLLVGVFAAQIMMASLATLGTLAVGIVTVTKA